MKIKITPFSAKQIIYKGDLYFNNSYYYTSETTSGIVTAILPDDDWLDEELSWVSKSEIPFITTIRHMYIQTIEESGIVSTVSNFAPILNPCGNYFKVIERQKFPEKAECQQLLNEYIKELPFKIQYSLEKRNMSILDPEKYYNKIDTSNELLIRCMASIYKAYILFNSSFNTFGEEIYINLFRALECLIENFELKYSINRNEAISRLEGLFPQGKLSEIEKEMRDSIRNDIIHPYRDREKRFVQNPFLMADYILEDLPFVDYTLKKVIEASFLNS